MAKSVYVATLKNSVNGRGLVRAFSTIESAQKFVAENANKYPDEMSVIEVPYVNGEGKGRTDYQLVKGSCT